MATDLFEYQRQNRTVAEYAAKPQNSELCCLKGFISNIKLQPYILKYTSGFHPFSFGHASCQENVFWLIICNFVGFKDLPSLIRNQEITQEFSWLSCCERFRLWLCFFGYTNVRPEQQLFLWQVWKKTMFLREKWEKLWLWIS